MMINDHNKVEESFKWQSKQRLFETIRKNQKGNIVLLSGDVHHANVFHSPCASLTGYNLVEFTSSGMSHTVDSFGIPFNKEFF